MCKNRFPLARAPLFNWKYCVIFPLLITQDSDLFKIASIHLIKLVPKPIFLSTATRKEWFNESKAFSIPIFTKKPIKNITYFNDIRYQYTCLFISLPYVFLVVILYQFFSFNSNFSISLFKLSLLHFFFKISCSILSSSFVIHPM